jgi:hypothetical protein
MSRPHLLANPVRDLPSLHLHILPVLTEAAIPHASRQRVVPVAHHGSPACLFPRSKFPAVRKHHRRRYPRCRA